LVLFWLKPVIFQNGRGYQTTIPGDIRSRCGIKIGDRLFVEYDDSSRVIKVHLPTKSRSATKLGKRLGIKGIEESIEKGLQDCLQ